MFGGKDKYVSLLSLIKRESPALYDVINELCLDGTFRSQRYQNTFLMPSKALVKQLEDLVANDNDDEAIDKIRSLLFKKHYSIDDFKTKDIVIGTLQSGSKVLKSPSTVGKHIKTGKKTVYASKTGEPTFVVYEYSSDEFPETVEGKSGGMVLAQQGIMGGAETKRMTKIRDLTETFTEQGKAAKTVSNYFKAVAGILNQLQNESDTDSFEKAKFYLSANPILSWFFLTMPGCEHSIVKDEHLEDFDFSKVTDADKTIKDCINTDYSFDKELFKKNPAQYEPQYGGWCAYAMGNDGSKVEVDPETFKILNAKLYLFYNKYFTNTLKSWNKDEGRLMKSADANWMKFYH